LLPDQSRIKTHAPFAAIDTHKARLLQFSTVVNPKQDDLSNDWTDRDSDISAISNETCKAFFGGWDGQKGGSLKVCLAQPRSRYALPEPTSWSTRLDLFLCQRYRRGDDPFAHSNLYIFFKSAHEPSEMPSRDYWTYHCSA